MTIPKGFLFSQSNLQDYVDCQRRFQLRHIIHQAWPAVEAEPYLENEQKIDQGAAFHQVVLQHLVGVPEEQISKSVAGDESIESWWNSYLKSVEDGFLKALYTSSTKRFEEIVLNVPIQGYRLVAKYDLLLKLPDNHWIILDWKTSRNPPKRLWLENRLQTHVYPYVLVLAGSGLNDNHSLQPVQIEMIYWFTEQPDDPVRFAYTSLQYQEDERMLANLVSTISQKNDPIFPLTPDVRRCQFCTYRSLCNRGVQAGNLEHLEEWMESESPDSVSIDFDQIGEIES